MGMLALGGSRHTRPCVYCESYLRQLALQTQRFRSGGSARRVVVSNTSRNSSKARTQRYDGRLASADSPPYRNRLGTASGPGFSIALRMRLNFLKSHLEQLPLLEQLRKESRDAGRRLPDFHIIWEDFLETLQIDSRKGVVARVGFKHRGGSTVLQKLEKSYKPWALPRLDSNIKLAFYGHLLRTQFTSEEVASQKALADLRYPSEWFPATRQMQRQIHLHVGPTNSGKTYHALQRLEQASSGIYAGPLRLLAHEVFTRMNAKGRPCSLITGEERRASPLTSDISLGDLSSCTVEMMPMNTTFSVAVIDEIQMLGDVERGWAWTQALMGVKASEVHLCGEERVVPLIKEICASLGESLTIHRYTRLSPLKLGSCSLNGKLERLQKGDCVVSFSVMGIHALKHSIEKATGKKVAIVYGSLPPETRAQQARLFNDPDNDYDYLVASDAVGMGLNLAIKRVVFETAMKYDGSVMRELTIAEIKQIAGRAGRYRIAVQTDKDPVNAQPLASAKGEPTTTHSNASEEHENIGYVTTLEKVDFPIVATALDRDPEPLKTAGLFPPSTILEKFAAYFPPKTPFSYILTRIHELCEMHPRFHLCALKDQLWIADVIDNVPGLSASDRNIVCSAPTSSTDTDLWRDLLPVYAKHIAEQQECNIVEVAELPLEVLDVDVSQNLNREHLRRLERLHKGIVTYLWLSYRFAGVFNTRAVAFHIKGLVEEKIEQVLAGVSSNEERKRRAAAKRTEVLLQEALGLNNTTEKITAPLDVENAPNELTAPTIIPDHPHSFQSQSIAHL